MSDDWRVEKYALPAGTKFGKWTVLEETEPDSYNARRWLCRCECGREAVVYGTRLRQGKSSGCQNCNSYVQLKEENLVGKKFGLWEVLELPPRENKHRKCLCRCECGNVRYVAHDSLASGQSAGCRDCKKKRQTKGVENAYWKRLVYNAEKRGLEVAISQDYLFGLLKEQVYRCALTRLPIGIGYSGPGKINRVTTASVDRIDSSKGYVSGNVQWVHKTINRMKNDYPLDTFLDMCRKVAANNPAPYEYIS